MKYFVMLGDGMADRPVSELGNKTPLQSACKPMMDMLASKGSCGMCKTVPDGMVPESDTANLAVLGYDPLIYSKGRSPLEAMSIGLSMDEDDFAFRCNIVTVSEDEENYEDKIMIDHSAGEITTEEARVLIEALQSHFGNEFRTLYTGISYRHCFIWKNPPGSEVSERIYDFTRPHDILGRRIGEYIPSGPIGGEYGKMYGESYKLLSSHPLNIKRKSEGKAPANSIWLWSPGKKPFLSSFPERFGLDGTIVSAVDLIKGIGICAGLKAPDVPGATGTVHTNYEGKAKAAIDAFENGDSFVYVHVEGPDECGHRAEMDNKIKSIEKIDSLILKPVFEYLKSKNEPFKILLMPDHPTPLALRTHVSDPVPFVMYDSRSEADSGISCYDETIAEKSDMYIGEGYKLIETFIEK
ncbi:MAG: cofactor-independent phosphoglycerate mutase [Ruminococcaceae bacterium]|nr:cofactor-independent phosphoglycerate mutase [Oscillospiraceae bacterium]